MLSYLTTLGVSPEIQTFFKIAPHGFSFGDDLEYFSEELHIVPTTENVWTAGVANAREVVITSSAMESVAYLCLNSYRYLLPEALLFIALGNMPHPRQFEQIRPSCQKRKITLAFGNDVTGRLADIIVAAGIREKPVQLRQSPEGIVVETTNHKFTADPESLTLNIFEKATGIRTKIRTRKPNIHNTFLDQLLYEHTS